jgi:hypothetical protein
LNDEKIICHPRRKLVKINARSRAGHFYLEGGFSGADTPSQENASAVD